MKPTKRGRTIFRRGQGWFELLGPDRDRAIPPEVMCETRILLDGAPVPFAVRASEPEGFVLTNVPERVALLAGPVAAFGGFLKADATGALVVERRTGVVRIEGPEAR